MSERLRRLEREAARQGIVAPPFGEAEREEPRLVRAKLPRFPVPTRPLEDEEAAESVGPRGGLPISAIFVVDSSEFE